VKESAAHHVEWNVGEAAAFVPRLLGAPDSTPLGPE